jgi:hypothetical protein
MKRRSFLALGAARSSPPLCSLDDLASAPDDVLAATRPKVMDGVVISMQGGWVCAAIEGESQQIALFGANDTNALAAFNRFDGAATLVAVARHCASDGVSLDQSLGSVLALARRLYQLRVCAPADPGASG